MGVNEGMFTSDSAEWETPHAFFAAIDSVYAFTLDAAASDENAKCERYYTKEDNALEQRWPGVVWCNPPYGREISDFVKKASEEILWSDTELIIMLVPCRTDTKWWQQYAMKADEIMLIGRRLKFVGAPTSAPFPSALLFFREGRGIYPRLSYWAPDAKTRGF